MSATVTAETLSTVVGGVLRRQTERERHAVKRIAREAHVTPRAVENWASGLNAPRAAELIRLMAINDELADEILRLVKEARCSRF